MTFRRTKHSLLLLLILFSLVVTAPSMVLAQASSNVCATIISQTLSETGVSCANNETGEACYASGTIDSVLADSVDAEDFDEPGETVSLADVITLRPNAIDTAEQTWGVSVLSLLANLPIGYDGNVVVIGLGGAELEDGVEMDTMFNALAEPVSVTTTAASPVHAVTLTDPDDAEVIGQVASGVTLPADAISEDGQWVRVLVNGDPGWVEFTAVDGNVSSLPTYGPNNLASYQSFYFRTGIDGQPCAQAPSLVVVQGPRDIPVDMIINGITIRIESTIVVRTLPPGEPVGPTLELITLFGMATVNPDTDDEIFVPPGFSLLISLGEEFFSYGIEGDDDERGPLPRGFGQPTLLTQAQLDLLGIVGRLPGNLLNYIINIPRLVTPSGIGQVITRIVFNNPNALNVARELCEEGILPENICQALGL